MENSNEYYTQKILQGLLESFEQVKTCGMPETEKAPVLVALSQEIRTLLFNPAQFLN